MPASRWHFYGNGKAAAALQWFAGGVSRDLTTNRSSRWYTSNDPWPPDTGEQHSVTYEKWVAAQVQQSADLLLLRHREK